LKTATEKAAKPGVLTKRVPARTKTIQFTAIKRDWMVMSDRFRAIRSKSRRPMDQCFWCKKPFENGDKMAIAFRSKGPNVVLCDACAEKALIAEHEGTVHK
jgi:hypothetical protein